MSDKQCSSGPEVIKLCFMLNSAEHEFFSTHKFDYANKQRNFHAQLCLARKNFLLLVICDLLAGQISCSAELTMEIFFITSGPD